MCRFTELTTIKSSCPNPIKSIFYTIDVVLYINHENHDIAIAMSPSRVDPVLPWLGVFKCLIQCYCTVWGYLNI